MIDIPKSSPAEWPLAIDTTPSGVRRMRWEFATARRQRLDAYAPVLDVAGVLLLPWIDPAGEHLARSTYRNDHVLSLAPVAVDLYGVICASLARQTAVRPTAEESEEKRWRRALARWRRDYAARGVLPWACFPEGRPPSHWARDSRFVTALEQWASGTRPYPLLELAASPDARHRPRDLWEPVRRRDEVRSRQRANLGRWDTWRRIEKGELRIVATTEHGKAANA